METRLVIAGIRNVRWAQDRSGMVIKGQHEGFLWLWNYTDHSGRHTNLHMG